MVEKEKKALSSTLKILVELFCTNVRYKIFQLKHWILYQIIQNKADFCGDILLPSTYKINYVNKRGNYVNMWLICVNMQHRYVEMQHNCVNMWAPGKHKVVACWHKYVAS